MTTKKTKKSRSSTTTTTGDWGLQQIIIINSDLSNSSYTIYKNSIKKVKHTFKNYSPCSFCLQEPTHKIWSQYAHIQKKLKPF